MLYSRLFSKMLLIALIIMGFSYTSYATMSSSFTVFKELGGQQEDPYLAFAEVMPEPVGGLPAIYKKISYPPIAKSAGLEGKVYLLVFINEHGGVDNVKVIKGIGGGCEEAATEAVKAVKYSPGKNNGAPVKVKLSLAITFKLK